MRTETIAQNPTTGAIEDRGSLGTSYSDILLRCPRCTANLLDLACSKCGLQFSDSCGVVHALTPERAAHYAQFIVDYERIRSAEGRGSAADDFYLALPYRDLSGRNSDQWQIRARTFDCLIERVVKPGLPGGARILDLGAGNCWLSFRLALAGLKPCAVDLLTSDNDGLGAAEHYRKHLPRPFFQRFQAELSRLPFQSEQFDAALFNASFHYAEDAEAALREALRCVKPGGIVIICDTPWYSTEASGNAMVSERRTAFLRRYGTDSASIQSIEYLTNERLQSLEEQLWIRWKIHSPRYGLRWAMRPFLAKVRGRREPAKFRIYVAQKV
jgi:ubiquinone/menaquinone biosynthesis C-methylase UbiE